MYRMIAILCLSLLPGCTSTGSASKVAMGLLVATRGYEAVESFRDCILSSNYSKSEARAANEVIDTLLWHIVLLEEGDEVKTAELVKDLVLDLAASYGDCTGNAVRRFDEALDRAIQLWGLRLQAPAAPSAP